MHRFHPPTVIERCQVMGMRPMLEIMGMSSQKTFDTQGNYFDRGIISSRCDRALRAWIHGDTIHTPDFPHPHMVMRMYQRTLNRIENAGHNGTIADPLHDFATLFETLHHTQRLRADEAGTVAATNDTAQDGRSIR